MITMESWCDLVSAYPIHPEPKHLAKALRTVETLISTDLAPFEIEWLVETLLFKPIDAINTIISKREECWHKNVADIFKLISKLASKYWIYIEKENEKLVQVCLLPFNPQIRKEAIHCLINILKNPEVDVGDAGALINALETDTTCRAPLALLVGSLCRYYPESVDQNYIRIWRIYLNMLQSKNNTDTIMSAILQGVDGLLENFGRDIAIQELQNFYKDFSRKCAKIYKCIEPLLSILKAHASLFREKLVEDKVLRLYLWGINSPNIKDALLSLYSVVFADVPSERIKEIIRSEIEPNTKQETSLVKHTALRIMVNAKIYHQMHAVEILRPDELEFQMRHRPISYEEADLVSLCLESRENYVKSLLMSSIMYYDHIPVSLRLDIVVKGILDAPRDVRKMALTLLVELSRQDGCLHKYADVWRTILDTDNKGDDVLKETIRHFEFLFKSYNDSNYKDLDQLLSLSNVLCFVLSASETDDYDQYCDELRSIIVEVAANMCVCPSMILCSKYLCIEMFKPKSILRELLSNFQKDKDNDTLSTLEVLLNQDNVETKLLIKAVSEMDVLLKTGDHLDQRQVADIIKRIIKLKAKTTESTCDSRILQRDLTMFIGEHGKFIEKEEFTNELYYLELSNKITLDIPNINEGTNYKIDLLRILQIFLQWEDFEALYCLLVIISANLRDRPDPGLQSIIWRCVHALFRTNGAVDVRPALQMCVTPKCVREAIYTIKEERNPGVRKSLCESLQVMLQHDPGSEVTAQLIGLVAEEMVLMISSTEDPHYQNGTDIDKVFLNTLHDDDNLTIEYLPKILILTSRRITKDLYKTATNIFIEKVDIFNENIVHNTINGVIKNMYDNNNRIQLEIILEFLKRIVEVKCYDSDYIVKEIFKGIDTSDDVNIDDLEKFVNLLQIFEITKSIFDFDEDISRSVVVKDDSLITNGIMALVDRKMNTNMIQVVLKFMKGYAVELLDVRREETIEYFGKLIENLNPESVVILKSDLALCLCTYKNILQVLPDEIINCYKKWFDKQNIQEITNSFYNSSDIFAVSDTLNKFSDSIHSLSVMSNLFDCPISETSIWTSLLMKNDKSLRNATISNMLSVSEKCVTLSEFVNMLQENVVFVQKYLNVYFVKYLLSESLVSEPVYLSLFVDAVKIFADNYKSYENYHDDMLRLFNKVWPNSESMGFENQLSVASDLFRVPKTRAIPILVEWVKGVIISETTSLDQKIRMITILPGGEEYSSCYRYMAGLLPIHLSEMRGKHAAILRGLLDALASSGDLDLLEIITIIAAADETKGWWDDAIDVCMASLADRRDQKLFDAAYNGSKKVTGLAGCRRVFVPLLKHSTRTFCEEYISGVIVDVLNTLKSFIEPINSEIYRKKILSYAKAFAILQVVIEKVPSKNLESGIINMSAGYKYSWQVIKDISIYSVTLRDKVRCPENGTDAIKDACLRLQCAAYNCLVAAICKRRPSQQQYKAIFNITAWSKVVDPDVVYKFPPRAFANSSRNKRREDVSAASTTSSFTGTVRTRMFMATLSENPLEFDMIPNYEDEEDVEEEGPEPYVNHPLNTLGVLSSITSLLEHASTLQHTEWLSTLTSGLTSLHVNAKWTLAQAICNTETDLKPHGSTLAPALLALVANTPELVNGRRVLNNLHIDILWTIMRWDTDIAHNVDLNSSLEYLISSCVEYKSRETVSRRLLATLNSLLQSFKDKIDLKWSFLQSYCEDLPSNASYLLPILQRILKNGVPLPGLLPIYNRFDAKQWISTSKLPEVFGLALSLEGNKEIYLNKFWQILDSVKMINVNAFIRILLYVQRVCWQCCNLRYIRIIADLTPKVEKSKCLTIISIYLKNLFEDDGFCQEMFHTIRLEELLDSDYMVEAMQVIQNGLRFMEESMKVRLLETIYANIHNSSTKVRKQALSVTLRVFQDLVVIKDNHPAKRRAVESTHILDILNENDQHRVIMEAISGGLFDDDEEISKMIRDGLEECLSKEMVVRFAELFYIIFYFSKYDFHQLSDYGYVFLDLLFRDLKQQEGFKNKKLSDQALPSEADISNVMQFTVSPRSVDVQMALSEILEVFLQTTKMNSQACQELLLELMKRFQGSGRRFDFDGVISKLLGDLLKKEPNCLTPLCTEASRIFLNNVTSIDGFRDTLKSLKHKILVSDAVSFLNILYEDLLLRSEGRKLFNFGIKEELDVEMNDVCQQFSIEGLTEVFGNLSNWNDLRIQEKTLVEESLPPLLVEAEEFESSMKNYFDERQPLDYSLWFNKMVGAYCSNKLNEQIVQYKEYWLKNSTKWPTREFVTSAVIEAIRWSSNDTEVMSCDIKPADCLAEWAARLMIRSSYFGDDARKSVTCRGDELKWCIEANRRGLPKLALQCIERNKNSLLEDEAISWFYEKVVAHRTIALKQNNTAMLQKALDATVLQDDGTNICVQKMILQLHNDLGVLTKPKLEETLASINNSLSVRNGVLSTKNLNTLKSVYDLAMNYYDDLWETNDICSEEEIISNMINIVQKKLNYNLFDDYNLLISILLYRLVTFEGTLSEDTARKFLDMVSSVYPNLDVDSIEVLKSVTNLFPASVIHKFYDMDKDGTMSVCKKYLQLIHDPQYTLLQYCNHLFYAKDQESYKTIFNDMKNNLFGNTFGGTDYRYLNTIKNKLYGIEHVDNIVARHRVLKSVLDELKSKPQRSVLRLSQLSPELSKPSVLDEQKTNLQTLLALPSSVHVVKFVEKIEVFRDSIRRPCVVSAILSNGITKRYIIKTGEPLSNDASVQRAIAILPKMFEGEFRSYNVTTLTENAAIIEYLEDHVRLRELMGDAVNVPVNQRLADDNLVLSPSLSLEQYQDLCNKVSVHILRSSIENKCASLQEFISKKYTFMETLCAMTIVNWLFGVGDRHLHNIMLDKRDGGVCSVDWGTTFQYGLREYVPARLTACVLAVCDITVLESRLQNMLLNLRKYEKLYHTFIQISFYWKGYNFKEMTYIRGILQGTMVSYQITKKVLEESSLKLKDNYINILDSVFKDFTNKHNYSVEEQVTCLLKHCTDVRLLSITPQGWEAWL